MAIEIIEFDEEEDIGDDIWEKSRDLSHQSYEFLNYFSTIKYKPSDEELAKIKEGRENLQKLMTLPEEKYFWSNHRIGRLHQLVQTFNTHHSSYTRNFVTDFIAENLPLIEGMVDQPGYIMGEDSTIPDIPGGAVLIRAISCLIVSGNPEYRTKAYQFLSQHKNLFAESLKAPLRENTAIINNILADPISPANEEEEQFGNVADFVRLLSPLSYHLFTTSWHHEYPVWIIQPNIDQYLKGEIDLAELKERGNKYLRFAKLRYSLDEIFKSGRDHVSPAAQNLIRYWVEHFIDGEISNDQLDTLADDLGSIRSVLWDLKTKILTDNKNLEHLKHYLREFLIAIGPESLFDLKPISRLVKKGIFPTPVLVEFVKNNGKIAFAEIGRLKKATENGKFNFNNDVQRDLEFQKYYESDVTNTNYYGNRYNDFRSVPILKGTELNPESMLEIEDREAQAAAFEAAMFYKFVYDRTLDRKRTIIFGNRRYGGDIVVEPLRPFLRDLGADVRYSYFHSSGSTEKIEFKAIEDCLTLEEPEQIIIVDGTRNIGNEIRRFPKSFAEIADLFSSLQGDPMLRKRYELTFWAPEPTEQINLGDTTPKAYLHPIGEGPFVILANPILRGNSELLPTHLRGHDQAYFDDIDVLTLPSQKVIFNEHGLKVLTNDEIVKLREQFSGQFVDTRLERVQDKITAALPEMIELVLAN